MSTQEIRAGDALEILAGLPTGMFDAVVTDPPYTAAGGSTNGTSAGHQADTQFFSFWMRSVMEQVQRVVKPTGCAFMFCDWRTINVLAASVRPPGHRITEKVWQLTQALVWDRGSIGLGSPFRNQFEMIAFIRGPEWVSELPKDISTVVQCRWPYGRHEHHGAEKPLELCRRMVRWAVPKGGGRILDPFAGSGTVGIACHAEGLDYLGIEIEPDVAEYAQRRISETTVGSLFACEEN